MKFIKGFQPYQIIHHDGTIGIMRSMLYIFIKIISIPLFKSLLGRCYSRWFYSSDWAVQTSKLSYIIILWIKIYSFKVNDYPRKYEILTNIIIRPPRICV